MTATLQVTGLLRELQPDRRVRRLADARRHGRHRPGQHDPDQAERGPRLDVDLDPERLQALRRLSSHSTMCRSRWHWLAGRAAGAERQAASRRCCGSSRASTRPDSGAVHIADEDVTGTTPQERGSRLRLPALRGVQAHDGLRERRVRPEGPAPAKGRDPRPCPRAARPRPAGGDSSTTPTRRRLSNRASSDLQAASGVECDKAEKARHVAPVTCTLNPWRGSANPGLCAAATWSL